MIKKINPEGKPYIRFQFKDLGMHVPVPIEHFQGCPFCLGESQEDACPSCLKKKGFNLIALGCYYSYKEWVRITGEASWDWFSSKLLSLKPDKPTSKEDKSKFGKISANLLSWFLVNEKKIDISKYSALIPIPSSHKDNQVDYFGVPLSEMLKIEYKTSLLQRTSEKAYVYTGASAELFGTARDQLDVHSAHIQSEMDLGGKNFILLDDIRTGKKNTMEKNVKLLKENEAGEILAVVLARTTSLLR